MSPPRQKSQLKHKRLCFIPLDARPVCYAMPKLLAAAAGLALEMPSPKLLGHLKTPADFKAMKRWMKNTLFENAPVIVALDTIAYGGLIPSRSGDEDLKTLEKRLTEFFDFVRAPSVYGFSSILRIPNYNNDEEEPAYWNQYGKALYQYSSEIHQYGHASESLTRHLPQAVLEDFTARRKRNLKVNISHIQRLSEGYLQYLTFCQDDTGPHGLNVQEAEELKSHIEAASLAHKAHVQTGADEVACCMLARWLCHSLQQEPRIFVEYSYPEGKTLVARFDGKPLEAVVNQQIAACGAVIAEHPEAADLTLYVHTPASSETKDQGDHCEGIKAKTTTEQGQALLKLLNRGLENGQRAILADVSHANGSDPALTEKLVCQLDDLTGLYGYAGWNTPGNTLGSALAMGVVRLLAEGVGMFNPTAFNQLLLTRLGDDWLYQADVRHQIRGLSNGKRLSETGLTARMADGLTLLKSRLGLEDASIHCRFPCQRDFEIELQIQSGKRG